MRWIKLNQWSSSTRNKDDLYFMNAAIIERRRASRDAWCYSSLVISFLKIARTNDVSKCRTQTVFGYAINARILRDATPRLCSK